MLLLNIGGEERKKKASHVHGMYKPAMSRILTVVSQLKILIQNQVLIKDCMKPTMPNYSYTTFVKKLTNSSYEIIEIIFLYSHSFTSVK